jgi:multidrug efflux pump subunit AcrA (membrane-fusion protein)
MKKRTGIWILAGIVAMASALVLVWHHASDRSQPGGAVSLPPDGQIVAEGRLVACPDAEVVLRSEYAGVIETYPARDHEVVRKGALLLSLRAEDVAARLTMAEASLRLSEARYQFADKQYQRAKRLRSARASSYEALDRARKNLDMAQAGKEKSEATVRLYRSILAKTRIEAPIGGVVVDRQHNLGEYVPVGTRLVTIADLYRTRIEAEVDEFDAGRVRMGSPVTIRAEGSSRKWIGTVVEISDRVSRKHLVPDDPSRPTDTGVVPVKIASLLPLPFKLGQKVTVKIEKKPLKAKTDLSGLLKDRGCGGRPQEGAPS